MGNLIHPGLALAAEGHGKILVALFIAFGEVPLENMLAMVEEKKHA